MIAVLFEVVPTREGRQMYLELAAALAVRLGELEGFVSIERFQSLTDPEKLLSLSYWRDEAALARWRAMDEHRDAQSAGRSTIFAHYRLRVASVVRDYGKDDRAQAPADSRAFHDPPRG
jgi:heme-degrading monooxygenase HmoA